MPALLLISIAGCKGKAPTDPKIQAQKLMEVFHTEDWKGLYSLIAVSAKNKSSMESADKFAEGVKKSMDASAEGPVVHQLFSSMTNIKTGDAKVTGNKAVVPTFCTVTVQGISMNFEGVANLTLDDGEWKWDLTASDNLEAETGTQTKAILGNPKR